MRDNQTLIAIIYMCVGLFVFSVLDASMKWLTAKYPVVEIAFFRSFFALIFLFFLLQSKGGFKLLKTKRKKEHFLRGSIDYLALTSMIIAFSLMPIADATAIAFAAPLFVTALSVPLLGEKVGPYRWGAVIVGFLGTILVMQPGMGIFNYGAIPALSSALFFSLTVILTKKLTETERTITIVFLSALIWTVYSAILLPFFWVTPDLSDMYLFVVLGLCGALGQYCLSESLRLASPSVVTPFEYSGLIWANIFGFVIWGEIPNNPVILGTIIIVLSGLYILYREAFVYKREKTIVDKIHQRL